MGKRKYSKQQIKKLIHKVCFFCGEIDYNLLDTHRIFEGNQGGDYNPRNTVVCCANHHRMIHCGRIVIHRKYLSTSGKWVVHYIEDGKENWEEE